MLGGNFMKIIVKMLIATGNWNCMRKTSRSSGKWVKSKKSTKKLMENNLYISFCVFNLYQAFSISGAIFWNLGRLTLSWQLPDKSQILNDNFQYAIFHQSITGNLWESFLNSVSINIHEWLDIQNQPQWKLILVKWIWKMRNRAIIQDVISRISKISPTPQKIRGDTSNVAKKELCQLRGNKKKMIDKERKQTRPSRPAQRCIGRYKLYRNQSHPSTD